MKKLLLSLVLLTFAVVMNAADWFVSGQFQGWSHCNANFKFTQTSAGVYELTLPTANQTLSGEFLIVQGTVGKPDWNNKIGTNGKKITLDTPYKYVKGANNFVVEGVIKCTKMVLNTNESTLTLVGETTTNEYDTVFLVGDMGDGWNDSRTDYPMFLKEGTDNVWEGDFFLPGETNYLKLRAGMYIYATGGDDIVVVPETTYTATMMGNAFAVGQGDVHVEFVLDYNAESGKLTITGSEAPVDYDAWYVNVIGDFNEWGDNGENPVDGISTHESVAIGKTEFKIKTWDGIADKYFSTGSAVPQNEWVSIPGNADANMTVAGAEDGQNFKVEFDCKNKAIRITPLAGLSNINVDNTNGEAVYYNLQGVPVANPANGMFIRVANGKSQKIIK